VVALRVKIHDNVCGETRVRCRINERVEAHVKYLQSIPTNNEIEVVVVV